MNYNMAVIHCVRVQCSVQQALSKHIIAVCCKMPGDANTSLLVTKNRTWQDCGFAYHDEGVSIAWVPSFLFGMVTLFFAMRLATKWIGLSTWGLDDTTITFAYVSLGGPEMRSQLTFRFKGNDDCLLGRHTSWKARGIWKRHLDAHGGSNHKFHQGKFGIK